LFGSPPPKGSGFLFQLRNLDEKLPCAQNHLNTNI